MSFLEFYATYIAVLQKYGSQEVPPSFTPSAFTQALSTPNIPCVLPLYSLIPIYLPSLLINFPSNMENETRHPSLPLLQAMLVMPSALSISERELNVYGRGLRKCWNQSLHPVRSRCPTKTPPE